MTKHKIEWMDLNQGAPFTQPGNYRVNGLGLVAVEQRHIDYVNESGEQWEFEVQKTPESDLWIITGIIRGIG